jgi:hypothetical protein
MYKFVASNLIQIQLERGIRRRVVHGVNASKCCCNLLEPFVEVFA